MHVWQVEQDFISETLPEDEAINSAVRAAHIYLGFFAEDNLQTMQSDHRWKDLWR